MAHPASSARHPRHPRAARPGRWVVGICLFGAVLTGLASWAAARADTNTEERLLQGQTRAAASVLSTAISSVQQPLVAALDVQRVAGSSEGATAFEQLVSRHVGPDELYVSAALWRRDGGGFTQVAGLGEAPGADAGATQTQQLLARALSRTGFVVGRVDVGEQTRIAYAIGDAASGLVVYAERAIPADRRAPVDRDAAFSGLHYAIYLGTGTGTASVTTTDIDPDDLPLDGLTAQSSVPFGDTVLTLVTTPQDHLGSALSQRLPWLLLLGGLLLTGAAALTARQLVAARQRAEADTGTITTLYQRVDSLFAEQRALFERLQRALLPQANPDLPGLEIASRYVAGAQGIDIGGDWYSAIALDDDTFAFVVGDVSGHGVDAVAEMARARFTLRAYLFDGDSPSSALDKCSRQFDVTTDGHIITALVGVGSWRTGEITVANAGHPRPLLVSQGEASYVPMAVGPPLGTGPTTYAASAVQMPDGSTLVAFTDGLVERRTTHIDAGMDRLARAAGRVRTDSLEEFVDELLTAMWDPDLTDDTAVLALRRTGPAAAPPTG